MVKQEGMLQIENIKLNLEACSKEDAISQMAEMLFLSGNIQDQSAFFKEVMDRESMGFTGAGNEMAIPHGISDQVSRVVIAVARLRKAVVWDTMQEGIPEEANRVKLIVLFAVPKEPVKEGETYIGALKKVCARLGNRQIAKELMEAEREIQVMELLNEG